MKKQFQSKAVPRGTRTIWRYLGALFILFTFAIGNVWGAVAKISFNNNDQATAYSATKVTETPATVGAVNVSWADFSLTTAYVTKSGTKEACISLNSSVSDAYNTKYVQFSSTDVITKVELLAAIPGSTSGANEVICGWAGTPSATPDTIIVKSIPGKGTTTLTSFDFPLSKGIKYVRCYRQPKLKDGKFDSKGTNTGSSTTWAIAYAQVTTESTTPVTTYDVTYESAKGTAPSATKAASVTLTEITGVSGWKNTGWKADKATKVGTTDVAANTEIANGSTVTILEATTFTAQWVEQDCKIYSFTGGIGSAVKESSDKASVDADKLVLSGSAGIIKLVPAAGETFKAGDVITISGTVGNTAEAFGVKISASNGKGSDLGVASVAGTTVPLIASVALTGNADNLYIVRNGGTTTTIYTCEVHRSCAEGTAAGLSYATAEVNKTEGDAKFTNELTNTNGLILAGYKSSNAEVATVNFTTGEVTIVGPGSATITAYSAVQTKAGTLYAAGSASYTLTVAALPKYTVTYDLNGGSGSPSEVDHKAGEKFNLHDGVTGITAPTNKTFVNWKDQDDALFAGGAEYTMPAKDVTLTAQWAGDVYTVKYMDGEDLLDTKVVEVGNYPADIEHPTKPLFTFAAWQKDASDIALDDASWTSVAKDAEITLTARWAKAYASNADFEAYIIANTSEKDDSVKADTYVKSLNYALSKKLGTTFDANTSSNNGAYAGLKIKNSGTVLSWNVVAGKVVELKAGVMVANGSLAINGGAATTIDGGSTSSGDNFKKHLFYSATEALYTFTTSNGSAEVIKAITMRDPYEVSFDVNGGDAPIAAMYGTPSVTLPLPTNGTQNFAGWYTNADVFVGMNGDNYTPTEAITLVAHWEALSTVNTLSDLKVDGVTVDGFDADVHTYYIVLPYGTTSLPKITLATPTNANATVDIYPTDGPAWTDDFGGCYRQQANVTPQDPTAAVGYNDIRITIAPKDGISIIKVATTGGTNKTVTGLYAGDGDVNLSSSKKMDKGKYIGFTLDGTTLQAGDRINVHTTQASSSGGSHIIFYDNMTDKNELYDTEEIGGAGDNIFVINAAMVGATTAYVYRASDNAPTNWNGYVDYIEVLRAMNPVLKSIQFNSTDVAVTSTSVSATLPYGTNLGTMTVTPEIIWNGAAAENSILINGSATGAWAWGANTYKLTDKDGDATTYTITLTEADHYEAMIVGGASYATLVEAVDEAQAGDVVKLLDNVDLMATGLTIAKNMTLDLNGFDIKAGERETNDIVVPASVKLTLVDNSTDADGKIYTEEAYTGAVTGYGLVRVAGELLMQSGNIYAVIDSDPANLGQFAVVIAAGGKVTVEGGQIKAGWYAISNNGLNSGSTIIVSGGELISTADYAIYNPAKESTVTVSGGVVYGAAGGIAMNRGELTVTGGTITSKDQGTTGTWGDGTGGLSNAAISASGKYESVEVEISGGTIIAEGTAVMITNGTTNPVEVAISGGQFSHVVPAEYCAPGFAPVTEPNANDKYEVEDKRIYIFDGSTMSNMATSPSGAIAWEIVGSTMGATDKNGTYDNVNYTRALQAGNSSTTKHFKIDVALNNNAKIEVIGMSNSNSGDSKIRHAWLTNSTDKGEIANAIASLESDGYNPEYFATDWLEEGSYYLHSDNTVNIFLIRVTEKAVDPKCEQPTVADLANVELCAGEPYTELTVSATKSDEGTLHYAWFKEAGETDEAVGTDAATYTPAADGEYYVIVTNMLAGHRDNAATSNTISVAHFASVAITTAPEDVYKHTGLGATLSVVAEGKNVTYEWFTCDDALGTNPVAIVPAETGASLSIEHIASGIQYYMVVATDECNTSVSAVAKVEGFDDIALQDVTGDMTWDFSKANDGTAATENLCTEKVLVNVAGINNDANFTSDNIMATANKFAGSKLQASMIKFHTTVSGIITVVFSHTGKNKPQRDLYVNDVNTGAFSTTSETSVTYKQFVQAGDVVLTVVPHEAGNGNMFNFTSVDFKAKATPDYTRNVSNNIGTLCVDHNVVAGGALGATFYQIAGRNQEYSYKIDFDEVAPGEELKAGEPYIFISNTGRIDLYYTNPSAGAVTDSVVVNGMHGVLVGGNLEITEENKLDVCYISENKLRDCSNLVGSGLNLVSNRAYIVMSEVDAAPATPAPGRRRMTISGDNAPAIITGCENLDASEAPVKVLINGQMFILRGEKMYDTTGRLVK